MKELARRALVRLFRSSVGTRALAAAAAEDPEIAVAPLRRYTVERNELSRIDVWPESIEGFEDLSFLFTSSALNFGVAVLGFDEAAYLYRLARSLPAGSTVVEIGRLRGGSTLILATATRGESDVWSFDLHDPSYFAHGGADHDAELRDALTRYGLGARVHIVVGDSGTAEHPPEPCDLVFVDGDHSYDGVRRDYDHWRDAVRPGGHLLFHDGAQGRLFAPAMPGVARLVEEIERDDVETFALRGVAGSIVHFERVGKRMEKP